MRLVLGIGRRSWPGQANTFNSSKQTQAASASNPRDFLTSGGRAKPGRGGVWTGVGDRNNCDPQVTVFVWVSGEDDSARSILPAFCLARPCFAAPEEAVSYHHSRPRQWIVHS